MFLSSALASVVREIERINEQELKLGFKGASWHDEYKGEQRHFYSLLSTVFKLVH